MFAVENDVCSAPTYSMLWHTCVCVKAETEIGGCWICSAIIDSHYKAPKVSWMTGYCQEPPSSSDTPYIDNNT